MKHVKVVVFSLALVAAVVGAVSSIGAQASQPKRTVVVQGAGEGQGGSAGQAAGQGSARGAGQAESQARRNVMVVAGRGARLGVMVRDLEADELAAAKTAAGVRIDEVTPASAAEKAGLKAGDVVVEYDGERVRSAKQLTRLVEETPEGRSVKIAALRNGQRQTFDATPEAQAATWNMNIDGDRIRREVERSLGNLERQRELRIEPREFHMEPPAVRIEPHTFDFRFDDMMPQMRMRSRSRLGVTVESLSPQLGDFFAVKDGGVLVSSVTKDSPAEKAGIKAGDVITSVNGDRVRDPEDLVHELSGTTGTEVSIGVVRDKKETTLKATLEAPRSDRPGAPAAPKRQLRPAMISFGRPA